MSDCVFEDKRVFGVSMRFDRKEYESLRPESRRDWLDAKFKNLRETAITFGADAGWWSREDMK